MKKIQKKILVVEDEPRLRILLKKEMEEKGYAALEAGNGDEALETLKNNRNIDLVVLDIVLPQRDGMDIFDILKRDFPSLKVIVSSVYPIDEQEFLIWDADDYYYKTDDVSVLMNKMAVLLKT